MQVIQRSDISGDSHIIRATVERSSDYCRMSFDTHHVVLYPLFFSDNAVRMLFWRVPDEGDYDFWYSRIAQEMAVQRRTN